MPIDTIHEKLMNLGKAAAHLQERGFDRPCTTTIWRWCQHGCRGIRLEFVRLGGKIYTSAEALDRFSNARPETAARPQTRDCGDSIANEQSEAHRTQAIEQAEKSLESEGL